MPQQAVHPLIRSYLKRRRTWSPKMLETAVSSLNRWCRFLDKRGVPLIEASGDDCSDYLAEREQTVAGSTAHKDWQHLCWLYRWLVTEGEVDAPAHRHLGPMHNVDAPTVNDPDPERVRACDDDTYATLMASFQPRLLVDCRNAAIVSLMYRTGLRRSEVCRCEIERMDLGDDQPWLEVLGKNGKWRRVPIAHETAVWLERYLRRLGPDQPAGDGAPLFVSTFNGSRASGGRIKAQAISDALERRAAKLGIEVTSHMFRRGMAIESKRRGMNDTTVMVVAGWSDPRMLARYQRAEREQLAAAEFHAADTTAMPERAVRRGRAVLRSV